MDETTNQILNSLEADLRLEASAARGAGEGPVAVALERIANAVMRNVKRREDREAADNAEEA